MGARYSRHAGYTISQRRATTRTTVRTTKPKLAFGPHTARYFGLAILAVIAIVVVTQSSTRATSAYQQNDLRTKLGQTNADIDALKLEAKRAQSLQSIQSAAAKQTMEQVPAQDITYVEKGDVAGVSTDAPSATKQP